MFFAAAALPLSGQAPTAWSVIERARATLGSEADLKNVVTLRLSGAIEPANTKLPEATILIMAREPASQRMEIKQGEIIETTILQGEAGCIIRSSGEREASQMRPLTRGERERVLHSTRQMFNFYRPAERHGETVRHAGIEQRRGERCHKLVYAYPDGVETIRFFSVSDGTLVSTVTDKGLEYVEYGNQTVGGIRFPQRTDYFQDGRKLHSIVLADIKVNAPLPSGIFNIPDGDEKK